jgi:peroxiredoxin
MSIVTSRVIHEEPIFSDKRRIIMSNTDVEVGSSAPDFKLPSNTGGEIALSDYRGKKIALFFVREYN